MHAVTGARRVSGLVAILAMLAGLLAAAPQASAASAGRDHDGQATPPLARIAGWPAGPVRAGTGYHRRDGSRRVREVQRRLRRLGFGPGPVDGRFGPQTLQAVQRFQRSHGLTIDGVVGRRTLAALRTEMVHNRRADWSAGPVGPGTGYRSPSGSARVREVQWDLRRLHDGPGPVDGLFGPRTEAAVRRFQSRRALAVDGIVGLQTLHALRAAVKRSARPLGRNRPASPVTTPAPRPRPVAAPPQTHVPPLPVAVVLAAILALGLLALGRAYVSTNRRVRAARQAAAQHGWYGPGQGAGRPPESRPPRGRRPGSHSGQATRRAWEERR